jgi:hypothetical protein
MKEYDLAFSLGFSCGTSQALRAAGLQFTSYPLDWTGEPNIISSVNLIVNDFTDWFEFEDFKLVDVRHGAGFCTRCYLNERTSLGFSHEFDDFHPFEESHPRIKKVYDRRVKRLLDDLHASSKTLAVYIEVSKRDRAGDEEIINAHRQLAEKFPNAEIDLLYVSTNEAVKKPVLKQLSANIFTAQFNYRKYDGSKVTHFIDWEPLVPVLKENFRVIDRRTVDEKKEYVEYGKKANDLRWGFDKSRFRRWLNKHLYKTYRSLERILTKRGLVQKEGPLWFWET